jgi:uncharacterized protein (DUF1697 family)
MTRYVAFLRGVSPRNAKMPALKACFESAGFDHVRTILGSGNVAFDARPSSVDSIARRATVAMQEELGRTFATIVRPSQHLRDLVGMDPFAGFDVPVHAKRVVTFLRRPADGVRLPISRDGATILGVAGCEAFTAYVASDRGPVFMTLLERTFGTDITTRTLDTVAKCAVA